MTSWAENNIPKQDLIIMQHDAVRRVREMQRQAMENLEKTKSSFSQEQNLYTDTYTTSPPKNSQSQQNNEQLHNTSQNKQYQYNNSNTHANNNGNIGANQNYTKQPFSPTQQEKKSPLNLLSGLFSKSCDAKDGFSDIINSLIPKRDGNSPISKILDALDLDTEKLIIIVLIVLLLNDGADYTLILALGYILL